MKTVLSKSEVIIRAGAYLGRTGYRFRSQTETTATFQGRKDIDWAAVIALLIFTVLLGMILYLLFARREQIILSFLPVDGRLDVIAAGNTQQAHQIATAFIKTLKL